MKKRVKKITITGILLGCLLFRVAAGYAQPGRTSPDVSQDGGRPRLQKNGAATQLMVDGRPFLIIGGELNNSTSSDMDSMRRVLQLATDLHFNTVLTPLSWELVEPEEGVFDFHLVDSLIGSARQFDKHLVFLWLASWKNGMSSYMPVWVKKNYKAFPRVKSKEGKTREILSTFSASNAQADAKAFAALMRHIRQTDSVRHTVLMIQIENEVGILDDSRDRSEMANAAFGSAVPWELVQYLEKNKERLVPEIKERWAKNGYRVSGTWEELFGPGDGTDEIFMAWNYACYVNKVAAAGKKEYPIPMYANAWLDQGDNPRPGAYPSGGPLAHVLDIWLAGAPMLDLLSPDLYVAEFEQRCQRFTQRGNPLFIPEMNSSDDGARNVFIAIGSFRAIGVSPFGIDRTPIESGLARSYEILEQISPLILEKQSQGGMVGFVVDESRPAIRCELGDYVLEISLDELFGHRSKIGYGIVMTDKDGGYIGAGSGFRVRFYPKDKSAAFIGIGSVDEGVFREGVWKAGRRLNGDENDQGRAWRFGYRRLAIEKCTVYEYE